MTSCSHILTRWIAHPHSQAETADRSGRGATKGAEKKTLVFQSLYFCKERCHAWILRVFKHLSSKRWKVPENCWRKLDSQPPPFELSGSLATPSEYISTKYIEYVKMTMISLRLTMKTCINQNVVKFIMMMMS